MKVFDFIDVDRIKFIESTDKTVCLEQLVKISGAYLHNSENFFGQILKREDLMSTGLGFELAFPHSKSSSVVDFFITIGISSTGIDWNSFDNKPVKMVFLIGGPSERQERYLKILASLSQMVNKQKNRDTLLNAQSPQEFYTLFSHMALQKNQAV